MLYVLLLLQTVDCESADVGTLYFFLHITYAHITHLKTDSETKNTHLVQVFTFFFGVQPSSRFLKNTFNLERNTEQGPSG